MLKMQPLPKIKIEDRLVIGTTTTQSLRGKRHRNEAEHFYHTRLLLTDAGGILCLIEEY